MTMDPDKRIDVKCFDEHHELDFPSILRRFGLRLRNGKPALALWIGDVDTRVRLMQRARSTARSHGPESVRVAACCGGMANR